MFSPAISWLLLNILSPKIKLRIRTSLLCVFTCIKHLNRVNHFDTHWIVWLSGNSSSSCTFDDFLLLSSPCCVDFSFSTLPHLWLFSYFSSLKGPTLYSCCVDETDMRIKDNWQEILTQRSTDGSEPSHWCVYMKRFYSGQAFNLVTFVHVSMAAVTVNSTLV